MFIAWVVFHVVICIALIIVVLMQSAKGEGLAGGTAFGGGVSGAVFGGRGAASFLSKATTVLAIVFMVNCGSLALMSSNTINVATGGSGGATESAVTRQAQAEREQALNRQQAQEEAAADAETTPGFDLNVTPTPAATTEAVPLQDLSTPPDTGGN